MNMTKKDLLLLVGDNDFFELEKKLGEVLEQLKRQDLEEELAQLKGLHSQYQEHVMEGTHSSSELNVEASRLRKSFVLFIEKVYKKETKGARLGRSRWFWPVFVLVGCLILIAIGSMKWPSIDFVLEGQTRFLAFRLDESWDLQQDLYLEEFLSFTIKSAQIDAMQLQVPEGEPLEEVLLSGGQLKWEEMDLTSGSVLNVEVADGQLSIQVLVDSLRSVLALRGVDVEVPNQDIYLTAGNDSTLVLADLILSEGPQMAFIPTQDSMFGFRLVPVSGLDFQRSDLEDDRSLQSELVAGEITARDISYSLENAPYLDLIQPESTTLSFYHKGDLLHVRVEGKAKDLTIGARPDAQKSVKPTIIEHLAKNGQANLIWNWVLGIVGLLGAVMGLLPKKKVN
jgi:hypothetical protein